MLVQKTNKKRTVWLIAILAIIAIVTIYTLLSGGLFGPSIAIDESTPALGGGVGIQTSFDTQVLEKLKTFQQWIDENILEIGAFVPRSNPFVPASFIPANENINGMGNLAIPSTNINSAIVPIVPSGNYSNPANPSTSPEPGTGSGVMPIAPIIPVTN